MKCECSPLWSCRPGQRATPTRLTGQKRRFYSAKPPIHPCSDKPAQEWLPLSRCQKVVTVGCRSPETAPRCNSKPPPKSPGRRFHAAKTSRRWAVVCLFHLRLKQAYLQAYYLHRNSAIDMIAQFKSHRQTGGYRFRRSNWQENFHRNNGLFRK